MSTSLRNQLVILFLFVIIIPFLLFAYYSYTKSIEAISITNTKTTKSYLKQAEKNFDIYLSLLNDQVNELIGDKWLQELFSKEASTVEAQEGLSVDMLSFMYQNASSVDAFQVKLYPIKLDGFSQYLSSIGAVSDTEEQHWFRKSRLNRAASWYLIMPSPGEYGKPLLTYVKHFTGLYDSVPKGLIVADLSEDYLSRYFSPSDQFKDQKIMLVNEDGTIYYDSNNNNMTGLVFPSKDYVKFMKSGASDPQSVTMNDQVYLATHVKVTNQPWYVVSLTPLNELTGAINETNRMIVILLIIYLLCCAGLVLYITIRFTQPITHLVKLIRHIEGGNIKYYLPKSDRKDEIGLLYRGIAELLSKIEGLIEEGSLAERRKKVLEFRVLSHQINPHFLYNTLEAIRWKAENHGQPDIGEMVSALGNLLRLSLNQGKEITTLRREIEQVKAYVQIEQARMGQKVRIFYFCDPELLERPFLRLLLQPLIENAIHHSVRDNFEKGKIVIEVRKQNENIVLKLSDNGSGIPNSVIERLNDMEEESVQSSSDLKGVGLFNVNERLKLYFGDDYRIQIESNPNEGTCITILHPILDDEQVNKLQHPQL
ncbi:sensor histidine kinase [Paenibacillus sp. FA6]|uniref:sensor histidine kinase n=1 Tax=Paenibacillus sp. FA6 TaxID=3413029 RepID=UPI003F65BBBA